MAIGNIGPLNLGALRFLVVEDHGFQRWLLSSALAGAGAAYIHSASDGAEALSILEDGEPAVDIIVTDLDMPGMDGLELIRHLGRLRYPASLIVATAMPPGVMSTVESMAREYGVPLLAALSKPVTVKKLLGALGNLEAGAGAEATPVAQFSIAEVAGGLARGEFMPYFQPQVDIRTGALKGAEALVRWRHPVLHLVRPAAFMEALESSPMMDEVTSLMLRESLRACAGWRKAGIEKTAISINVPVRALRDATFAERLLPLVREQGLDPRDVVIEVTESEAQASGGEVLENFGRLRMRGFGLSIDDFGTGYSSMERLARVPFTELKIDRSFVAQAGTRPASRAMLESSLHAALRLGIVSVAEGVEKRAEWDLLGTLGCDRAQGYYIGRPMEAQDLVSWSRGQLRQSA